MNGYEHLALSYRKLIEQGELTEDEAASTLKTLDFLATCSQEDIFNLVDSGAFNDIMRNYFRKSLHKAELDKDTVRLVISEFNSLLEWQSAKQISEF